MGLLGDKLLKAGVVSQADADRLHLQEIIEKENQRKAEERREARAQAREQEDRLRDLAAVAASLTIKNVALGALGFTKEERESLLTRDPPPTLELLRRLGNVSGTLIPLLQGDPAKKAIEEERERLLQDPKFRTAMMKHL